MTNPELAVRHENRPTGPGGSLQTWRIEEQRWHDVDNYAQSVIGRRSETVVDIQSKIDALNERITELQSEIADLQAQVVQLQSLLPSP